MKKLNKTEINALASKIYDDYFKELQETNVHSKVFKSIEKKVKAFFKSSDYKIIEKYNASYDKTKVIPQFQEGDYIYSVSFSSKGTPPHVGRIKDFGTISCRKVNTNTISISTIVREITLAQIDAPNLNSIILSVVKSLKK